MWHCEQYRLSILYARNFSYSISDFFSVVKIFSFGVTLLLYFGRIENHRIVVIRETNVLCFSELDQNSRMKEKISVIKEDRINFLPTKTNVSVSLLFCLMKASEDWRAGWRGQETTKRIRHFFFYCLKMLEKSLAKRSG